MTSFTVEITDSALLAGITAAREAKNAGLSLSEGQARADHPDYLANDAAYVSFVMTKASESYARGFNTGTPQSEWVNPGGPPDSIEAANGRVILIRAGLFDAVNTYMASLPANDETRVFWDYKAVWSRNHPAIAAMTQLLGLTSAQVDQMFRDADGLD